MRGQGMKTDIKKEDDNKRFRGIKKKADIDEGKQLEGKSKVRSNQHRKRSKSQEPAISHGNDVDKKQTGKNSMKNKTRGKENQDIAGDMNKSRNNKFDGRQGRSTYSKDDIDVGTKKKGRAKNPKNENEHKECQTESSTLVERKEGNFKSYKYRYHTSQKFYSKQEKRKPVRSTKPKSKFISMDFDELPRASVSRSLQRTKSERSIVTRQSYPRPRRFSPGNSDDRAPHDSRSFYGNSKSKFQKDSSEDEDDDDRGKMRRPQPKWIESNDPIRIRNFSRSRSEDNSLSDEVEIRTRSRDSDKQDFEVSIDMRSRGRGNRGFPDDQTSEYTDETNISTVYLNGDTSIKGQYDKQYNNGYSDTNERTDRDRGAHNVHKDPSSDITPSNQPKDAFYNDSRGRSRGDENSDPLYENGRRGTYRIDLEMRTGSQFKNDDENTQLHRPDSLSPSEKQTRRNHSPTQDTRRGTMRRSKRDSVNMDVSPAEGRSQDFPIEDSRRRSQSVNSPMRGRTQASPYRDSPSRGRRHASSSRDRKRGSPSGDMEQRSPSEYKRKQDSPTRDRRQDIPSKNRRQEDSPSRDRRQESPYRDRRQDSPFRDRRQDSPFRDRRQDIPSKNRRQEDSPSSDRRQDSPSRDRRQDSPSRDRRQDSPFRDRRQDIQSKNRRQEDSPSRDRRQDSPSRDQRRDDSSRDRRRDSPSGDRRRDSPSRDQRRDDSSRDRRRDSPSRDGRRNRSSRDRRHEKDVSTTQESPPPDSKHDGPENIQKSPQRDEKYNNPATDRNRKYEQQRNFRGSSPSRGRRQSSLDTDRKQKSPTRNKTNNIPKSESKLNSQTRDKRQSNPSIYKQKDSSSRRETEEKRLKNQPMDRRGESLSRERRDTLQDSSGRDGQRHSPPRDTENKTMDDSPSRQSRRNSSVRYNSNAPDIPTNSNRDNDDEYITKSPLSQVHETRRKSINRDNNLEDRYISEIPERQDGITRDSITHDASPRSNDAESPSRNGEVNVERFKSDNEGHDVRFDSATRKHEQERLRRPSRDNVPKRPDSPYVDPNSQKAINEEEPESERNDLSEEKFSQEPENELKDLKPRYHVRQYNVSKAKVQKRTSKSVKEDDIANRQTQKIGSAALKEEAVDQDRYENGQESCGESASRDEHDDKLTTESEGVELLSSSKSRNGRISADSLDGGRSVDGQEADMGADDRKVRELRRQSQVDRYIDQVDDNEEIRRNRDIEVIEHDEDNAYSYNNYEYGMSNEYNITTSDHNEQKDG